MSQYVAWLGIQPRPPRTGLAYIAVRVAVYIAALALMVLVYGTKQRGLLIAPPVGLLGAAGTWYMLGDTPLAGRRRLLNAAGVGVLLAELTWAFGYWNVPALVGGAGLWLNIHIVVSLVGFFAVLIHAGFPFQFRSSNLWSHGFAALAAWLLLVTTISGVFGRYLYRHLPAFKRAFAIWKPTHLVVTALFFVFALAHVWIETMGGGYAASFISALCVRTPRHETGAVFGPRAERSYSLGF